MNSIERVYKDRTLKGPAKAIMAYLVYRANDAGLCFPGMATLQEDCGISENTRKTHMKKLVAGGYIAIQSSGTGRSHKRCIRVNDHYTKGVKFTPLCESEGGQIYTPSHSERGSESTPLTEERGSNLMERGSNLRVEEQEEHKEISTEPKGSFERERITPARKAPAGAGEYEAKWYDTTGSWLGVGLEDYLRARLGDDPRWELVRTVHARWKARGYKAKNVEGILDWYDEYRRNPNWEPPRVNRKGLIPANSNGHSPNQTKRAQIARDSMSEVAALLAQGGE